jgi:hypothetical protein
MMTVGINLFRLFISSYLLTKILIGGDLARASFASVLRASAVFHAPSGKRYSMVERDHTDSAGKLCAVKMKGKL